MLDLQNLNSFKNKQLPSPMLCFNTNKNMRSFLVRAKLPSLDCDTEAQAPLLQEFALKYTPLPMLNSHEEH